MYGNGKICQEHARCNTIFPWLQDDISLIAIQNLFDWERLIWDCFIIVAQKEAKCISYEEYFWRKALILNEKKVTNDFDLFENIICITKTSQMGFWQEEVLVFLSDMKTNRKP